MTEIGLHQLYMALTHAVVADEDDLDRRFDRIMNTIDQDERGGQHVGHDELTTHHLLFHPEMVEPPEKESPEQTRRRYYEAPPSFERPPVITLSGWPPRVWNCICGRQHASWWGTAAPPSCTINRAPLWRQS